MTKSSDDTKKDLTFEQRQFWHKLSSPSNERLVAEAEIGGKKFDIVAHKVEAKSRKLNAKWKFVNDSE